MGNIILLETVTLLPFSDTNCKFVSNDVLKEQIK